MNPTRRGVLLGGCGFAALLAASTLPLDAAEAALLQPPPGPRHRCPHQGCRHFRAEGAGDGTCALSVHGVVPTLEVP